jgi:hypothetical protein
MFHNMYVLDDEQFYPKLVLGFRLRWIFFFLILKTDNNIFLW